MMFTTAGELRGNMPAVLMDCQLLKVPINKLDRAKLTSVLKTAEAHDDIIVNIEEGDFARMNMETATKKWLEVCDSMDWECKDFLILIGGKGKICEPLKTFKAHLKTVQIDDIQDSCPILVDNDWFKTLAEFRNKKRSLSEVGWSEKSLHIQQSKKPETENDAGTLESNDSEDNDGLGNNPETPLMDLNATLEEFKVKSQQMLDEQRQQADAVIKEMKEHYEKRIKNLQEHNEYVTNGVDQQAKENEETVTQLKGQIRQQENEKLSVKHDLAELQNQVQKFDVEKRQWQVEMQKLRDMVQSQNSMLQKEVKEEPNAVDITFGTVNMDSDEECPFHSSPCRSIRKVNTVSKGIPTSLGKLGMTVFNPAKHTKIEYLSKFVMMVEDFNSAEDFKQIKQLVYQAFADDKNFRIQDLSTDDKSSLEKLAKAIIRQDDGDSIDLMKSFDAEQLKHGETHLNFLHRVSILYECAANFSDAKWKELHFHAQKIYNKIDDSLPTAARSKFRELMMEHRKKSSMTFGVIRESLETVLLIYGDEFKSAMGSQGHIVPMVDAIQSKSRPFTPKKKEVTCWNCGSTGHMRRFCPEKGNNREPKTSGRRNTYESKRCFICNGTGHFAAECPNRRDGHKKWDQGVKNDQ